MTQSQKINCSIIVMAYLLSICALQQTPLMPWPRRNLQIALAVMGVWFVMHILGRT
jgi:hypothetical protein